MKLGGYRGKQLQAEALGLNIGIRFGVKTGHKKGGTMTCDGERSTKPRTSWGQVCAKSTTSFNLTLNPVLGKGKMGERTLGFSPFLSLPGASLRACFSQSLLVLCPSFLFIKTVTAKLWF